MPKTVADVQVSIAQFVAHVDINNSFPICEQQISIAKKYYKFLQKISAVENFDFLAAEAHYSQKKDSCLAFFCPATIKGLKPGTAVCAAAIWNEFVSPNAPRNANLGQSNVQAVMRKFNGTAFVGVLSEKEIADLFVSCSSEIRQVLARDPWLKFRTAWKGELDAKLLKAQAAQAAPILAKLRGHQKTKLAGNALGLKGKHPSGKFVLFPMSLDGVPTLLTSSAVDKGVNVEYVTAAAASSSTIKFPTREGLWLRYKGADKVETYWVEDNPAGTARLFGQALTNMGINTPVRPVSLTLLQAELHGRQSKKAPKPLMPAQALMLSAEAGVVDLSKVWGLAKPNAKKAIPQVAFTVAEREFTEARLREALTKVMRGKWPIGAYADEGTKKPLKHWVVVHSSPDADQDRKLFGGIWLYKGETKPSLVGVGQFVGKEQAVLPPGWLIVVTQAEAKAALDAARANAMMAAARKQGLEGV